MRSSNLQPQHGDEEGLIGPCLSLQIVQVLSLAIHVCCTCCIDNADAFVLLVAEGDLMAHQNTSVCTWGRV